MRILHTCLNVSNLDRSIAFYSDIMGLKLTRRFEVKQNNAEIVFMEDGENKAIELTHWRDKEKIVEGDNFDHIAFGVRDVPATIEQMRAKGVTIAMEPFSLQGSTRKIAFVKDPDGNWLELIAEA